MESWIVETRGLKKYYKQGGSTVKALDGVDFRVKEQEFVAIIGKSGSGKSTLIKLINGLLIPTGGTVLIDGMPPGIETKKIVSYLPEQTYLSPSMKVADAITYFTDFYHDFRPDRALKMLKDLDIDTNARLKTLSKGAKEKVQLILVMSRDAMLYILDEPIGGVDSAAREYILRTILMNYNENATILLSTHLIQDIENVLDRVIFLQNGRTVLNATVDEIRMEQRKSVDVLFREVYRC